MRADQQRNPTALRELAALNRHQAVEYRHRGQGGDAAVCIARAIAYETEANRLDQSATESVLAAGVSFCAFGLFLADIYLLAGILQ